MMSVDWRKLSPQEVLDAFPALTPTMVAYVIPTCWARQRGTSETKPSRRKALDLIKSGALQLVDPDQPYHRWCVTSDEIRRYLAHGPRKGGDVTPIRAAS